MPPADPSLLDSIRREILRHRAAYAVVACFVVAGPFVTGFLFPDAPPLAGLFGGLLFGFYAAFCAVPEKFLDD